MRIPQRRIEAHFAHAARLTAFPSGEAMAAREALKIPPGMGVRLSFGVEEGDSLRPASHALLAEDLLALHAHAGHEHTRMSRKNWVKLGFVAKTAN
jgi:hypothetical protein